MKKEEKDSAPNLTQTGFSSAWWSPDGKSSGHSETRILPDGTTETHSWEKREPLADRVKKLEESNAQLRSERDLLRGLIADALGGKK